MPADSLLEGALAQHERELDPQQLVEHQPAPSRLLLAIDSGAWIAKKRRAPVDQA